ncbi:Bem46-like serine peptidase Serine peptidase Clan SC Family S09X [Leptomonas seymouri]|uniref:Bem46-like serine peptidase Serine peptidase Clan SC Family S09X n=1 Tax=Leptomonas seymouri TaxID=5684 RepID=A0A0N1IK32_LEPSE|nr:Bem46-like serine peptidase Serine peptidase Clan SC Family S09X [Leptomonas seymouri]|eukprot:KPI85800.1 Bem46-like serine peptidase Serine peptidase Clan SC Family S09X [Leptomonas seymouri]
MSFGGFLMAAALYVGLVIVFISAFLHLISFRFRSRQSQMLYYPEMPPESRESCEDPVALGIPYSERVTVTTEDQVRLRGFMLWPNAESYGLKAGGGNSKGSLKPPLSQFIGSAEAVSISSDKHHSSGMLESSGDTSCSPVKTNDGERNSGAGASAVHAAKSFSGAAPPFVLLYLHGNAGNVGHRLSLAQAFVMSLRCAVMMVDYRGFGLSDDAEPTQEGLELDAQACFDCLWQDNRVPRDRIVVMGTSLGGAVAIHLSANERYARRIHAVIVENTFTSVGDMASALGRPILTKLVPRCPSLAVCVFEYYIKPLALHIRWCSIRRVQRVTAPMLFLSGGKDELVPLEQMRALYKESTKCLRDANNSELTVPLRRFQEFENGMHNNLPLMPGYMGVIQKFLTDANQSCFSEVV